MSHLRIINVTADVVCILFLLVLIFYMMFNKLREDKDQKARFYLYLCIGNLFMILGDIPNWMCEGHEQVYFPVLLWIGCFVQFLAGIIVPVVYSKYLCEYMKISYQKVIMRVIYVIGGIGLLADILNLKYGFFYFIDPVTNVYHRGSGWWISQLIVCLIALIDVIVFFFIRKNMRKGIFFASMLYVFIPFIAIVAQSVFYGIATTYIATTLAIYIIFFNLQSDQLFLLNQRERELQESKISIMMSQIQPHFLYNSIAAIQSLCEENPLKARDALGDFSFFLRGNMDSLKSSEPIPFEREINHIKNYLQLEKLRLEERLMVEYDFETEDFMITPLSLQPVVENAVKHGVARKKEGGTVRISTRIIDADIVIMVEDDGVGFDVAARKEQVAQDNVSHVGFGNVRNRVEEQLYGTMSVTSESGVGTKVTIRIPKEWYNESITDR